MAVTDMVYDDCNLEQIANIEPNAPHRNVDLAIFQADKEGVSLHLTKYSLPHN